MKKWLNCFVSLMVCMLLLCGLSSAWASETVGENEAKTIATDYVRQQTNLSDADMALLTPIASRAKMEGHSGEVWTVYLSVTLENGEYYAYVLYIEPFSGGVIGYYPFENGGKSGLEAVRLMDAGMGLMARWREEKGESYYWPMEDYVYIHHTYFDDAYRLPQEGDLPFDDAIRIAKEYAMSEWGFTQEYIDSMHANAFLTKSESDQPETWLVYLVDKNIINNDSYLSPHMFGVSNPDGEVLYGTQGNVNSNG